MIGARTQSDSQTRSSVLSRALTYVLFLLCAVRVTVTGFVYGWLVALVISTKERCGRVWRVFENRRFAYRSIEIIAVTGKARLSFLVNSYARTSLARGEVTPQENKTSRQAFLLNAFEV